MAIYTCEKCGMSIGSITCGSCGKELVHDTITTDGGATVLISKCPEGHGKIKSPMCCGQDMSCSI
jgi:predicted RNA-binding protein with PUA domain